MTNLKYGIVLLLQDKQKCLDHLWFRLIVELISEEIRINLINKDLTNRVEEVDNCIDIEDANHESTVSYNTG